MKNKRIDNLRKKSKQYCKTVKNDSRWNHKLGIKVYHMYYPEGHEDYKKLSYWDDVAFIKGSQQVTIWWTHPRYMYEEELDQIAYEEAKVKYPDPDTTDWLGNSTPVYKYLGKNKKRKRIKWHILNHLETPREFYTYWRDRKAELCSNSNYEQKCKFEVKQYDYCRGVEITCPVECRSEEELAQLVEFVNKCLDDPSLFNATYGDYKYTKDDYLKEKE